MELNTERLKATFLEHWRSFYFLVGNRRRFERQALSGDLTAIYDKGYGEVVSRQCSCIDFSPRGLGVFCPEPIPPDTLVQLIGESRQLMQFGRVRHCHSRGISFSIGFEFVPAPEDKSETF